MVNLGGLPEPATSFRAAPLLQSTQELGVIARRIPQPPRRDTGRVPGRIHVRSAIPQVLVPAEAIDGLAAYAAEARSARKCLFAIGRWRRPKAYRQTALAPLSQPPRPAWRRAAARR